MSFFRSILKSFFFLLVTIGLGVLWHFVYEWSNNNVFLGLIAPVNESVWEHLKLLFYPCLVLSLIEYFVMGKEREFIVGRIYSIILGMISIVAMYYLYDTVFGATPSVVNIIIYVLAVILTYGLTGVLISRKGSRCKDNVLSATILTILIILIFALFTQYPPNVFLFIPPVK